MHWSIKLPQQEALTAWTTKVSVYVRVMIMTVYTEMIKDCKNINPTRNTPQLYSTFWMLRSESCLMWVYLSPKLFSEFKVITYTPISYVVIFPSGNSSKPRQPQREALMNTRIISGTIWGDLRVVPVPNVFSYIQLLMSFKTAPTSSTYTIQQPSQCSC